MQTVPVETVACMNRWFATARCHMLFHTVNQDLCADVAHGSQMPTAYKLKLIAGRTTAGMTEKEDGQVMTCKVDEKG